MPLFTSSSFSRDETISIVESTWHDFEHQDLIGIKDFNSVSILELFHGPTAAFKDFGLQLAAAFFNKVLESENKTAIVLVQHLVIQAQLQLMHARIMIELRALLCFQMEICLKFSEGK